jgi:hypothetical protein
MANRYTEASFPLAEVLFPKTEAVNPKAENASPKYYFAIPKTAFLNPKWAFSYPKADVAFPTRDVVNPTRAVAFPAGKYIAGIIKPQSGTRMTQSNKRLPSRAFNASPLSNNFFIPLTALPLSQRRGVFCLGAVWCCGNGARQLKAS